VSTYDNWLTQPLEDRDREDRLAEAEAEAEDRAELERDAEDTPDE
jgi:hypothetical protein